MRVRYRRGANPNRRDCHQRELSGSRSPVSFSFSLSLRFSPSLPIYQFNLCFSVSVFLSLSLPLSAINISPERADTPGERVMKISGGIGAHRGMLLARRYCQPVITPAAARRVYLFARSLATLSRRPPRANGGKMRDNCARPRS